MSTYYFKCSKDHTISFNFNDLAYKKFLRLCNKGLRVCPECKPDNQLLIECEIPIRSKIDYSKGFSCKEGHMNYAYLFTNGIINLSYNDIHENFINLTSDSFLKKIETNKIKCIACKKKLKAIDSIPLLMPELFNIKTKKRLGDIWGNIDPKETVTDSNGIIYETKYGQAVKKRINKMRRERLTKMAGNPLKKPTNQNYKNRLDRKPNSEEIN